MMKPRVWVATTILCAVCASIGVARADVKSPFHASKHQVPTPTE